MQQTTVALTLSIAAPMGEGVRGYGGEGAVIE